MNDNVRFAYFYWVIKLRTIVLEIPRLLKKNVFTAVITQKVNKHFENHHLKINFMIHDRAMKWMRLCQDISIKITDSPAYLDSLIMSRNRPNNTLHASV